MVGRLAKRLSARSVASLVEPGLHADGDGLYLRVDAGGAKRWAFIFQWHGKRSEMGLGPIVDVSLAEARDAAGDARKLVRAGTNPIDQRRASKANERAAVHTFGTFSDELISTVELGFRNTKHRAQWRMTLVEYARPIRDLGLDEIGTDDVLRCLQPIWRTKAETASRVRGRIERVLDAAKARALRSGENPARWKGHLDQLLPKRLTLTRGHHTAMPYSEVPAFVARIRGAPSMAAYALEWTILSASRTNETLGARFSEIDRGGKVWTIPGDRMKAGREHRVPITTEMERLLDLVEPLRMDGDYLFQGTRPKQPLSGMAMTMLLRRMKVEVTVHGFRSAFRDWVGEETDFASEIAEAALAHVVGDATERAYRRGDALDRRRRLMDAWASFLAGRTIG